MEDHGLTPSLVQAQLEHFRTGFPRLQLEAPATLGRGIIRLAPAELHALQQTYDASRKSRCKFVPASGAATRLFKKLHAYLEQPGAEHPLGAPLASYPFAPVVEAHLARRGQQVVELEAKGDYAPIVRALIGDDGLRLAAMPKALIPFHRLEDGSVRTPVEEHLVEGALYARQADGTVSVHFTVSPQHEADIRRHAQAVLPAYEQRHGVRYQLDFSQQAASTDTIAARPDGSPYRDADGRLVFRPAGHGALLQNLGAMESEMVFIKNIDNVAPDHLKGDTVAYSRALGGLLLKTQREIFDLLDILDTKPAPERVFDLLTHAVRELQLRPAARLTDAPARELGPERADYLRRMLNRPLRVCGMVRNQGEPGGGPFWVRHASGEQSLQIVETSQMDTTRPEVQRMLRQAEYFNPVEIVCGLRNRHGERFDLQRHVDPATGFIARKTIGHDEILAQELPGLWNGAQADWISLFVEVPPSTFTPVKEIADLLRAEHR